MVCNVFGHEPAIAEYVIMLTHRLFEAVTAFRAGSWIASPQSGGGRPTAKCWDARSGSSAMVGSGVRWRKRAAGLRCRVLAANRSPIMEPAPAETIYPLAELDRMLLQCDTS